MKIFTHLDVDNRTPLHLAASEGHLDIVKYLIEEQKVEVNVGDRHGNTPLFEAISGEHTEVVEYIKSKGGELIPRNNDSYDLCEAVLNGDLEKVKALIEKGIDINAPGHQGSTGIFFSLFFFFSFLISLNSSSYCCFQWKN